MKTPFRSLTPAPTRYWGGLSQAAKALVQPRAVLVLLLVFAAVWISLLQSVLLTVPMDNVEQWVWSLSLQWGYHKHPPLPTWALWLAQQLAGRHPLTAVVLGAICSLASVALMYALLRQIWSDFAAWLGVLAALSITFYSGRLNYFNHNITLMLCVSLTVYSWWQILQTQRTRWWVALGLAAGLGMLSKYQYMLVLLPSLVCAAGLRPWTSRRLVLQMGLALAIAALLFAPHALWLLGRAVSDGPIAYALKTSRPSWLGGNATGAAILHSSIWLLDLVLNRSLPALLLLLLVKGLLRKQAKSLQDTPPVSHTVPAAAVSPEQFLLLWGGLPALSITALGIVMGMDLQLQWGTAFALWLVPAAMVLLKLHRLPWSVRGAGVAIAVFALLQVLLLVHSYRTSAAGCCTDKGKWRNFDSPRIARELDSAARQAIGGHFLVLAGAGNAIGAIAMALPDHPRVLLDSRPDISPWITSDELFGPGVVQVFPPDAVPDDAQRLPSGWAWKILSPEDIRRP